MLKTTILFSSFFLAILLNSCQYSPNHWIEQKNRCFDEKLKYLKKSSIYKTVISEFEDTFRILKNEKNNFGIPSAVENKIDEAIFFKKDGSECLLIVLQKPTDTLYSFGSARMISGVKNGEHWKFAISLEFDFEKDWFKDYPENSFENISKLARYSVMTENNKSFSGCEINDNYWFKELKQ